MAAEFRTVQEAGRRLNLASLAVEQERKAKEEDLITTVTGSDTDAPVIKAVQRVREELADNYSELLVDRNHNRKRILAKVNEILERMQAARQITNDEWRLAYQEIETDYFGWGRITDVMEDPEVSEVIIDGPDKVDVERNGRLERTDISWGSEATLLEFIRQIIRDVQGRSFDTMHPVLDCEVRGARINITGPPVTTSYTMNIRKSVSQTRHFTPEEYVRTGAISWEGMRLLLALARGAATILVCGPMGSGKTTLSRILIESGARPDLRWIVIEDTRETQAQIKRFLSMQTVEREKNPINVDDLFKAVKRKRPDRIAVGEVRSGDQAAPFIMSTLAGHEGPITTTHAGGPHEVMFNFVFYLKQAGYQVSEEWLERLLHRQLNIMVFVRGLEDGNKKVMEIIESLPLEEEGSSGFSTIMRWNQHTDTFEWVNDLSETMQERLSFHGVVVPRKGDSVTQQNFKLLDVGKESLSRVG